MFKPQKLAACSKWISVPLVASLAIGACGKEKEDDPDEEQPSAPHTAGPTLPNEEPDERRSIAVLLAGESLPECSGSHRGETYYVLAEERFRYCDDSDNWTVIDLNGAQGAQGAIGAQGPAGLPGQNGAPATPGATWVLYSGATRVGRTLTNPLDAGFTWIPQNDPTFVELETRTFGYGYLTEISQGKFAGLAVCAYESADCSGVCYMVTEPQNYPTPTSDVPLPRVIVTARAVATEFLGVVDFASPAESKTIGSQVGAGPACYAAGYAMNVRPVAAYTMPSGLTYPISGPLSFQAE